MEFEIDSIKRLLDRLEFPNTEINTTVFDIVSLKLESLKYVSLLQEISQKPDTLNKFEKTPITEWILKTDCSIRLKNVLLRIEKSGRALFIEDITEQIFLQTYSAGKGTLNEFKAIRRSEND